MEALDFVASVRGEMKVSGLFFVECMYVSLAVIAAAIWRFGIRGLFTPGKRLIEHRLCPSLCTKVVSDFRLL